MTLISNDPSFWPQIALTRTVSYFAVAGFAAVVYDWVSTLEQEGRCTNRTPDLFIDRYGTGAISVQWWMLFAADIMLGAIVIIRLHAMYQRSKKMFIFLIATFFAVTAAASVIDGVGTHPFIWEEFILSGTYQCHVVAEDQPQLSLWSWVIGIAWEALTLCLAVWIAIQHFRKIERVGRSTASTIGDFLAVLIKSHVLHFIAFATVSYFRLGYLSPKLSDSNSARDQIYYGIAVVVLPVQLFVLGPRLILSIREYHTELADDSDAGTGITTIAFQEFDTGSSV
ncbi:uncharacterized protein F5147DRAFT_833936 [Suillus discolor]|uniref:Uncharacterized protein n=1 Tax=Suillus discolor TaxID=1912936 RepID=A0A9P7FFU4_9AGAM|nr:uncharacterized protein F5147DRAFT_833936 [Suillus discolor]KAG2115774.1 hypothetical protein F5147DRAFT_833936 [Suillus discolor]